MENFLDNERFRKLLFYYPSKAIQFLYEYYYNDLLRISKNLTHDHEASQDILQEVFLHVWAKHEWLGQQHEKSIEHYLVKVVQYKSITLFKSEKQKSNWRTTYKENLYLDKERTPEEQLISQEMIVYIRKLIATFPRREQQCYLMSREEEMTNKQIAETLKISSKAVERSITSARKRLRKHWIFSGDIRFHF